MLSKAQVCASVDFLLFVFITLNNYRLSIFENLLCNINPFFFLNKYRNFDFDITNSCHINYKVEEIFEIWLNFLYKRYYRLVHEILNIDLTLHMYIYTTLALNFPVLPRALSPVSTLYFPGRFSYPSFFSLLSCAPLLD